MWRGRSVRRCGPITSSLAGRAAAVMTEAGTDAPVALALGRRRLPPLLPPVVPLATAAAMPAAAAGELALTPMIPNNQSME